MLLFLLAVPVFSFFVSPIFASSSRRHEFEADAYACVQADGRDLGAALLKLMEDNASPLTPDPLFVRFYYSHPPARERLAALARLGWLTTQPGFYTALGVQPSMTAPNDAVALLLFLLVTPVFSFFVSPLFAQLSRKHEFQADAYACAQASGADLAAALLKLHQDNAATLTPDPLYVRFYYSHPPASERLAALLRLSASSPALQAA